MSDTNTRPTMPVTVFNNLRAQTGVLKNPTWAGFCETIKTVKHYDTKESQQLIKLGIYENNSRAANSKLVSASGIEIDYDAGQISMTEAAKRLNDASIKALLCSTYTSTPAYPKWRAFIPFEGEVAAEHRAAWVAAVDSALGGIAAPESFTPKQIFFFGRGGNEYQVIDCEGEYINTLPAMKQAADDYATNEQEVPKAAARHAQYKTRYTPSGGEEEEIREALTYIPAGIERTQWIRVIAALHSKGLYELALEWSSQWGKFNKAKFDKEWHSFDGGTTITIATLFLIAKEHGYKKQRQEKQADTTSYSANQPHHQQSAKQEPPPFQATGANHDSDDIEDDLLLVCADDVETHAIKWAVPDYIAAGKINLFAGVGGVGKSTIACDLVACMTTGRPFANGKSTTPGDVIIFAPEDDEGDTFKPRLEAAGADLKKVFFIGGWLTQAGSKKHFDPIRDIPKLMAALKRLKPKALILDPVTTLVDNQNDNAKVRIALQPMVDLGKEIGTAIIAISHFRKGQGDTSDSLDDRVMGSQAWTAVARMVLYCYKSSAGEKVFFKGKSNIAKINEGYVYDIDIDIDKSLKDSKGSVITTPKVLWGEYIEGDELAEFLSTKPEPDAPNAKQVAEDFLKEYLAPGERLVEEIFREAKSQNISESTLRRAKRDLKIQNRKRRNDEPGAKKSVWFIEDQQLDQATPQGEVGEVGQVTAPDNTEVEVYDF